MNNLIYLLLGIQAGKQDANTNKEQMDEIKRKQYRNLLWGLLFMLIFIPFVLFGGLDFIILP